MGEWDVEEVRRLFTSLEFRSLFDRLMELARDVKPKVEVAELDLRQVPVPEPPPCWPPAPSASWSRRRTGRSSASPPRPGAPKRATPRWTDSAPWATGSRTPRSPRGARRKTLERSRRARAAVEGVAFDTMLAGYLLEPGPRTTRCRSCARLPRHRSVRRGGRGDRGSALHRGSVAPRGVGGRGRRPPRPGPRRADRPAGTPTSWTTWSSCPPRSWPGWRRAGSAWTFPTSRRWGSRSAIGWPR